MRGRPQGYAPKTPARGVVRGKPDARRIVVQFDAETFDQIAAKALAEECSFAEIVRRGVEWMLMEARP
jgi:hypothetical protein